MAAVLDVVEGLTGYPRDLLDLDLDLEADLGVDTVKQAEVFAAVRERFAIPRLETLRLRDFPTLAHVIGFARDRAPQAVPVTPVVPVAAVPAQPAAASGASGAGGAAPAPAAAEPAAASPGEADVIVAAVLDVVEGLTGYPRDLLDLDLDLEADLGVDTVKQAEVFAAVRERFAIPRLETLRLRDFPTLAHVIGFARDRAPQAATPAATAAAAAGRQSSQPSPPSRRIKRRLPRRSRRSRPSPATSRRRGDCRAASRCRCCARPRSGASPPP